MQDYNKIEKQILEQWEQNKAFQKQLERSKNKKRYVFFDGPPFATGLPHYGHILAGTIKDSVPRFFSMNGYFVDRIFGFDCHGLPVEHEIDKTHSLDREKILELGIKEYNTMCKSIVTRYSSEWKISVNRLGRWVDFDRGYKTMDFEFMQKTWEIFGSLYEKKLVYKGYRVMPFSTGCETPLSNFEANQNYKDVDDLSIYFSVVLKKCRACLGNGPKKVLCRGNCELLDIYPNLRAAVWTTTPWTLPANLCIAVNPTFQYFIIKRTDEVDNNLYIILNSKASDLFPGYSFQGGIHGRGVVGLEYEPLFDYLIKENDIFNTSECFSILGAKFITSDCGTGVVHLAPGFGLDDHQCFVENNLIEANARVPCPVDDNGRYTDTVYDLKGKYVKEVDTVIIAKIRTQIIKTECVNHRYPFCWRSDTPLLYKIVPNWFIRVKNSREKLVANNAKITWSPENVGTGRFENWVANAEDWSISRNRFWGTPIPIFQKTCNDMNNEYICVSSYEEILKMMITGCNCCEGYKFFDLKTVNIIRYDYDKLNETVKDDIFLSEQYKTLSGSILESLKKLNKIIDLKSQCKKKLNKDIHREFIDLIQLYNEGQNFRRITEVLDCWFESGAMPYGISCNRYSYPNTDSQGIISNENSIPADFIGEGLDQTRGWFYTLLVISSLLYDKPPYLNVIVNGIVLAQDGKKMSKRLKNYPDPLTIIEKYGADSLRMYLLSSPVVEAENLKFSENGVKDVGRRLLSWWNCLNIIKEAVENNNLKTHKCVCDNPTDRLTPLFIKRDRELNISNEPVPHFCSLDDLDIFILQSLSNFSENISRSFLKYRLSNIMNDLDKFLDDLSNWYIRIKRTKIRVGDIRVLLFVMECLSRICAPFAVFYSEYTYQEICNIKQQISGEVSEYESVHWTSFPYFDEIEFNFEKTKHVIEAIRSARAAHKLPIKRPLKEVYLVETNLDELSIETIKLECNVLNIKSINKNKLEYDVIVKPNFATVNQDKNLISAVNQLFGRPIKPKKKIVKKHCKKTPSRETLTSSSAEAIIHERQNTKMNFIDSSILLEEDFADLSLNEKNYSLLKYLQNDNTIKTNLGEIKLEHTIHSLDLKSFQYERKPNEFETIDISPLTNDTDWIYYSNNNYDLILNKKLNIEIVHLMCRREFRSAVQKLRKKCLLKPTDSVRIVVDFLSTENKYNLSKRELYAVLSHEIQINTESEVCSDELICEDVKIAEFDIRIRLFK
ncbi:putative isoleucine--tRNA ligase, cytoplasmic [Cucumispora dikerogammari]|nr:putative isoleucine--tRNA ligase, cytoplasmic [Cucumispora dikerogammari]